SLFRGWTFSFARRNCLRLHLHADAVGSVRGDGIEVGIAFADSPPRTSAFDGSWVAGAQSAGMGAGRATTGRAFAATDVSGVSSHLRTSGRAFRIAASPALISSPARLKSS